MGRVIITLGVVIGLFVGALSWRLHQAFETIDQQQAALKRHQEHLADKNSQLIALSLLTETNSQAQTQLYAAAERNRSLLRERQRTIEALIHENETLRHWAATQLPDDVIRLQQRPTFTRGEDYRHGLSDNHRLPARGLSPENQRRTSRRPQ